MQRTKGEKRKSDDFFRKMERLGIAASFGDLRLRTCYSEVLPADAILTTNFSRRVSLKCPIVSSAMDTVTEAAMAIEMAKHGGLGIIHRGLSPIAQAAEVAKVKFHLNGLIKKPITVAPGETMAEVLKKIEEKEYKFRSFPVVNGEGKLIGLITANDFDFCPDYNLRVGKVMSQELITANEGVSIEEVFATMQSNKKKILPVLDGNGELAGMYVHSDAKRIITGGSPHYNLDVNNNLIVGAAIGTGEDTLERVELLVKKGVDVVVIDTAHGDSKAVVDMLKEIKRQYDLDVVVGNISEGSSAVRLVDAGADGIKIGQGPGSICTTRIVAGIGCPQVTAVYNCSRAVRGTGVPTCADGGIKYSGDITIALAIGADCVMLGGMLAGTKEAPGEVITRDGMPVKSYRGMGSLGAMQQSQASRERYGQSGIDKDKLTPEGVEGVVPFKGDVGPIIHDCLGGLRSGMGYTGSRTIQDLQENSDFHFISGAGLGESHPSITITKAARNYSR